MATIRTVQTLLSRSLGRRSFEIGSMYLCFIAIFALGPKEAHAQVLGICTDPDGNVWASEPEWLKSSPPPQDPRGRPMTGQSMQRTQGNAMPVLTSYGTEQMDTQELRRWMRGEFANGSGTTQRSSPASGQPSPHLNRYAQYPNAPPVGGIPHSTTTSPHQVAGVTWNTPYPATGAAPHQTSVSAGRPYAPHSVPARDVAFRRNQGDDDLLAPTPGAANAAPNSADNGGDLLAPIGSSPSPLNLSGGGDALSGMGPDAAKEQQRNARKQDTPANNQPAIVDPHWEVYANDRYPSAHKCAKCHQKIYDEWRVSSHAYSVVSPMFNRFEQKVAELTRGTAGTFCLRCHAPVATQANYPREASIFNGPSVYREGITCIACHRVVERYGRVNGERRIELGNEYDPMVGNTGGDGIPAVIADRDNFKVKIDPSDKRPLQPLHQGAIQFEQLSDSSFCAGCHQVAVQPGIALEVVYQQYRQGPACKKGISCQDCHMGAVPGKPLGYTYGAAAEVNNKTINNNRKHSNHMFWGPAVPLAHPGIFPHNEKSFRWTADQWLQFDHKQGWGTDAFEAMVARGQVHASFPPVWKSAQERRDARKIIDENQKLIGIKRQSAVEVLENGSRIDGPFFASSPRAGQDLKVSYVVSNTSEGHNMPSGSLGAQPQLWLNVVLIGPNGQHLWESGHLDTNGDLCDWHSLDVRANKIKRDSQLMNFQTKFLITNVKGTEREMYLPVNVDADPLPFFRPGTVPYTVLNHPPFIRMEAHSIPPLDSRTARYSIPAEVLRMPGVYRLSVRLRSRVEPPYFMLFCDGTPEMVATLNESILDAHPYSTEFVVR